MPLMTMVHQPESTRGPRQLHGAAVLTNQTPDEQQALAEAVVRCKQGLYTPNLFREWLLEQPLGSCVGLARSAEDSPLARFLTQYCGRHVSLSRSQVWIGGSHFEDSAEAKFRAQAVLPLPYWAVRFEDRLQQMRRGQVLEVVHWLLYGESTPHAR